MSPAPTRNRRTPSASLVAWAGLLGACSPDGPEPVRVVRLEQVRPRPEARQGVFLNEALVLHFSSEVDGASVTRESFVVRPLGETSHARGRFEIDGRRVSFVPDLGRARDLSDGGFRPGTRYEVLVRGFPVPDGIRSLEGRPLARSARFEFETAALTEPRGQLFNDLTPTVGAALRLEKEDLGHVQLKGNESLMLVCPEPLDPSTLVDGEFVLKAEASVESIPLDARLEENSRQRGARLALRPQRIPAPGTYNLRLADPGGGGRPEGLTLRDFGGNPVWYMAPPTGRVRIVVHEAGSAGDSEYVEDFIDDRMHSPLAVPDADGSAHWSDLGVVTIRYPRIAGSGQDGACALQGSETRKDIHATRLVVPGGTNANLVSIPGLVVLRSQGRLAVEGRLVRRAGEGAGIGTSFAPGEASSTWLGRALEDDPNWTVIVAGGDLVVSGEIEVDGPLLLVAGGRIRITGRVRAQKSELWLLGQGGGGDIDPTASRAELRLDPPFRNPLVEPLTFAVISSPMPRGGGVSRWVRGEPRGEDRNGSIQIHYLPPDVSWDEPLEAWGAVESPSDLLDADSLRVLIHLTVVPPRTRGQERPGLWYPPVVDQVRLTWEP